MTGEQKPGGLSTTPDLAGLCERLNSHMGQADLPEVLRDCREAAAAIESLVADNERMREALKPFAAEHECDGHATVEDFNMEVQIFVRWATIKAARTALEGASDA